MKKKKNIIIRNFRALGFYNKYVFFQFLSVAPFQNKKMDELSETFYTHTHIYMNVPANSKRLNTNQLRRHSRPSFINAN